MKKLNVYWKVASDFEVYDENDNHLSDQEYSEVAKLFQQAVPLAERLKYHLRIAKQDLEDLQSSGVTDGWQGMADEIDKTEDVLRAAGIEP